MANISPNDEVLIFSYLEIDKFTDLHVYVIPEDIWQGKLHTAYIQATKNCISAGFIRIGRNSKLSIIREVIDRDLGDEFIPESYVFCKVVGRSIAQVRDKQEVALKVKNFIPPESPAEEIFLLDRRLISKLDNGFRSLQQTPLTQDSTENSRLEYHSKSVSRRRMKTKSPIFRKSTYPHDETEERIDSPPSRMFKNSPDSSATESNNMSRNQAKSQTDNLNLIRNLSRLSNKNSRSESQLNTKAESNWGQLQSENEEFISNEIHFIKEMPVSDSLDSCFDEDLAQDIASVEIKDVKLAEITKEINEKRKKLRLLEEAQQRRLGELEAQELARKCAEEEERERMKKMREEQSDRITLLETELFHVIEQADQIRQELENNRELYQQNIAAKEEEIRLLRNRMQDLSERTTSIDQEAGNASEELQRRHEAEQRIVQLQRQLDQLQKKWEIAEKEFLKKQEEAERMVREAKDDLAKQRAALRPKTDPPLRFDNDNATNRALRSKIDATENPQMKLRLIIEAKEAAEGRRMDLVRRIRFLHAKLASRRNLARDYWKKMYFDVKKTTGGLENKMEAIKNELDGTMRKAVNTAAKASPNNQSAAIQAFDLRRRLVNENRHLVDALLKLSVEIMLRVQTEKELKSLKFELDNKRSSLALIRLTSQDKTSRPPPLPLRLQDGAFYSGNESSSGTNSVVMLAPLSTKSSPAGEKNKSKKRRMLIQPRGESEPDIPLGTY